MTLSGMRLIAQTMAHISKQQLHVGGGVRFDK